MEIYGTGGSFFILDSDKAQTNQVRMSPIVEFVFGGHDLPGTGIFQMRPKAGVAGLILRQVRPEKTLRIVALPVTSRARSNDVCPGDLGG